MALLGLNINLIMVRRSLFPDTRFESVPATGQICKLATARNTVNDVMLRQCKVPFLNILIVFNTWSDRTKVYWSDLEILYTLNHHAWSVSGFEGSAHLETTAQLHQQIHDIFQTENDDMSLLWNCQYVTFLINHCWMNPYDNLSISVIPEPMQEWRWTP